MVGGIDGEIILIQKRAQGIFMMEGLIVGPLMVMERWFMMMAQYTMASGKVIIEKVKVLYSGQMEQSLLDA